ncbi:carbohydrate porin [Sphingomonas kyungheensis]|uniref:Carbohydrate porin n=1 Tax=Sphingomonas kyungheensis TaxID=1069987 RepID=A0ABU8H5B0_9SPHN
MSASLAVLLTAQAIVSPPAAPAPPAVQPPPPVAADSAAVTRWQHDNAVGKTLRGLQRDGVDLGFDGVENVAGNPIGGARQGVREAHFIVGTANLDLERLFGLSKTRVHIQGAWFTGDSLGREVIGNSISLQSTFRPVPGPRLTQLSIEHDFGRLNLLVGRADENSYFNNSPLNCSFMSSIICLTGYGAIPVIGITGFPFSAWAAKARYAVDDRRYVQVMVTEHNMALHAPGKGGLDFSLGKGSGVLLAGELGYQTSFAQERLPRRYKLGVFVNTDGGTSPYYDGSGASAALSGRPRAALGGSRVALYGLIDRTIARAPGAGTRNLALFARGFWNVGNVQMLDSFVSAGFVKTGTFRHRDEDTVGIILSDAHFSDQQIGNLRDLRARAGGHGAPHHDEIVGEFSYGWAALHGFKIYPVVQYVLHPDPMFAPKRRTDVPSAVVLGLRADVRLAQLFGG